MRWVQFGIPSRGTQYPSGLPVNTRALPAFGLRRRLRFGGEILAGVDEQVLLVLVLLIVQVSVASFLRHELFVRATFDDLAVFEDQDLIGAADGREAVGDDEGGAALAQIPKAFLDQRFALAVEAGGGFVEDQDARVGQDGAGDGDALALPARELDAPLADNRVVPVGEALDEPVRVGDAADFFDLFARRLR